MEDPRRGALVPGGHRSAPTEAAAETLAGIFDATEVSSELSCPTAPSVCRPLFSPAGSVSAGRSPLGSCAISDGGETRRSASAVDSRLWQLATARAHREDSTRSRRGMVLNSLRLVFSHLSGGVWRRPAPRPLRKISPPNGGSPRAPLFCGLLWGDLRGLAFSNFFLRSP